MAKMHDFALTWKNCARLHDCDIQKLQAIYKNDARAEVFINPQKQKKPVDAKHYQQLISYYNIIHSSIY